MVRRTVGKGDREKMIAKVGREIKNKQGLIS